MRPEPGWTLVDWLHWQEQLHPKPMDLTLERVREVGARLGVIATAARTLTVAGTNGKGGSATLLATLYREGGYRVGLYTSPHLLRYNERVAVDGAPVGDAELCEAFVAVEHARRDVALTYFEFGTLAALWLFRERAVDVQVLEVGLGGRLDAVNIVDADGALVVSIGLDHTDWLGNDRESIGREKAGVLRAGRPAVCSDPAPPASLAAHAAAIGARLYRAGRDFSALRNGEGWDWSGPEATLAQLPLPGLTGPTQVRNAAGVLMLVAALQPQLPLPEAAIRRALPRLVLPGRFERRGRVILDVAHNAEAAAVLAENLRATLGARRIPCVLGMLADKPVREFAAALAGHVERFHLATLPPPRGLTSAALGGRIASAGVAYTCHDDVGAALAAAIAGAAPGGEVLACGSFLTVGAVMELLGAVTELLD